MGQALSQQASTWRAAGIEHRDEGVVSQRHRDLGDDLVGRQGSLAPRSGISHAAVRLTHSQG